jgi:hypothetical protein
MLHENEKFMQNLMYLVDLARYENMILNRLLSAH